MPVEAKAHADRVLAEDPESADSLTLYGKILQAVAKWTRQTDTFAAP